MYLLVGLGNPGKKYEKTRHNAGFMILDRFHALEHGSRWSFEKKWMAQVSEAGSNGEKIIMVKPQTFMNRSGVAVRKIAKFYKIKPERIIAAHDELDLPLGETRIKLGGSSAGHKGVQSVIDAIGKNFWRVRLGIAPQTRRQSADKFVLSKFTKTESANLKPSILEAAVKIKTHLDLISKK